MQYIITNAMYIVIVLKPEKREKWQSTLAGFEEDRWVNVQSSRGSELNWKRTEEYTHQ